MRTRTGRGLVVILAVTALAALGAQPGSVAQPYPPAECNQINGTPDDDRIRGTSNRDCIDGKGGDDRISARAGHDLVEGGDGDDRLRGRLGDDRILGGEGTDVARGGQGEDTCNAETEFSC